MIADIVVKPVETPPETPRDEAPPTDGPEFVCQEPGCTEELTYSGRGRHPKYCDKHKPSNKGKKSSSPRASSQNAALASQATELIVSMTDVMAIGAMLVQFHDTEEAITDAQPDLRDRCYAALVGNPARARSIIRILGGATDLSLVIALMGFAVNIGSTAVNEYRGKRAARQTEDD
jgi:hypothetical protein